MTFSIFFLFFGFIHLFFILFLPNLGKSETFSISDCDSFSASLVISDRGGGGAGRAAAPPLFWAPAPTFCKSNTMILFLFSILNMKKLFSIVSPPTFHLAPRSLVIDGCDLFPLTFFFFFYLKTTFATLFFTAGWVFYIHSLKGHPGKGAMNIQTRGSCVIFI